jgi:hypothetical protein
LFTFVIEKSNIKMKKLLLSLTILGLSAWNLQAQTRYVDEVYTDSDISIDQGLEYAQNYTVLFGDIDTVTPGFQFLLQELKADIYHPPFDDQIGLRPVLIYLHTGSFLPRYINNTPTGDRDDSATVEICKAFARKGYVVMSMSYRLGWNPLAATENDRRESIINAAYRGVQDVSAAIRYIKDDVSALGNPYGVDTTKIALGGQGTGGYITSAFASLNSQEEIRNDKFRRSDGTPMVNDAVWGDRHGFGGAPGFSNENWPGHTTAANVAFQIGGALGDSAWINEGEIPLIWVHSVLDPFAPYKTGMVNVPGTTLQVVEVSGGYDVIKSTSAKGNNKIYEGKVMDDYTFAISKFNEGLDGLYPIHGAANASGPYEWYDTNTIKQLPLAPATIQQILGGIRLSNPMHDKTKAMTYIDSIVGFVAPRVAVSLGLVSSVGIDKINLASNVAIGPNPASNNINVYNNWDNNDLRKVEIRNLNGQLMHTFDIDSKMQNLPLNLNPGLYIMNMQFDRGTGSKKFMVN